MSKNKNTEYSNRNYRAMEIMARKDEINGQREGRYRKTLRPGSFAIFHIYVHIYIWRVMIKIFPIKKSSDLNIHTSMYVMLL